MTLIYNSRATSNMNISDDVYRTISNKIARRGRRNRLETNSDTNQSLQKTWTGLDWSVCD